MAEPVALDAPIVAVTVYPSQARVTRSATVSVPAGETDVALPGLPTSILDDSVRVSGKGEGARIVGVDVTHRFYSDAPDLRVTELEERLRDLRHQDQELADADAAEATRASFLDTLAQRGGRSFARALASGEADAAKVTAFGETIATEMSQVQGRRRDLAEHRERLGRDIGAVEAELASIRAQQGTERREVVIAIEADVATTLQLEVAYVVLSGGWYPVYDARLEGERVTITWQGMVAQASGEDWPAADLTLSTARPAVSTKVPELDPWYVGAWAAPAPRGGVLRPMAMAPGAAPADAHMLTSEAAAPQMQQVEALAEQGVTAMTYRLPRPVPVPADGAPHKATIATVELEASLDHITVPKLAEEAYLRATVTNTSPHTLLPGKVSVYHGADFVGTTNIDTVAPGAEVELQLGVDDRIRVERELVRRDTDRKLLGGKRKVSVGYRITVENHSPRATKLTVLDQFPVSRHEAIKMREHSAKPEPAERTDLDVVTWKAELDTGAKATFDLGFELEHPSDMHLSGWTE